MIDSKDCRARYKTGVSQDGKKETRSAKLFPHWDGPYPITEAFPEQSQYRLNLGTDNKSHNMFNINKRNLYVSNDVEKFPEREPARPEPVIIGGGEEYFVKAILDEKRARGKRLFYVHWAGYPVDEGTWETLKTVKETEVFKLWEKGREAGGRSIFFGRGGCKDCALCLRRGRTGGRSIAGPRGGDSQADRGIFV
mgnify:FL=1